jgi:hypothetical protein
MPFFARRGAEETIDALAPAPHEHLLSLQCRKNPRVLPMLHLHFMARRDGEARVIVSGVAARRDLDQVRPTWIQKRMPSPR